MDYQFTSQQSGGQWGHHYANRQGTGAQYNYVYPPYQTQRPALQGTTAQYNGAVASPHVYHSQYPTGLAMATHLNQLQPQSPILSTNHSYQTRLFTQQFQSQQPATTTTYNNDSPFYTPFPNQLQQQPHSTPQPNTNPSITPTPVNKPASSYCKKYYEQNACGCKTKIKYAFCNNGEHDDDPIRNKRCYDNRLGYHIHPKWKRTTIKKGDKYCDDICHAKMTGWICCTCRLHVWGYLDTRTNGKLVHRAADRTIHEFCGSCSTKFPAPQLTQTVSTTPQNFNNYQLNVNAGNVLGNGTFPTVHFPGH